MCKTRDTGKEQPTPPTLEGLTDAKRAKHLQYRHLDTQQEPHEKVLKEVLKESIIPGVSA